MEFRHKPKTENLSSRINLQPHGGSAFDNCVTLTFWP